MNNLKTLGALSAGLLARLYDENKPIFNISDVQHMLGKNYNEATDLLSELVRRRIITRLRAGKYLIIPQELGSTEQYIGNWYVAAREVVNSPRYYIAFYSALQHWGMLTQPLVKIFAATPKRQIVPREMRNKLTFVYTKEKFIWGIKEEWVTSTDKVRISDLEKTLVDALAHPEYCGGITEIAKGIWMARERIDFQKLKKYVIKYDKNVVAKRLGYILDIFRFDQAELLDLLRSYVKERYDIFDPTLPLKRVDKNNWRLIDNVGQKQMLDLIRH